MFSIALMALGPGLADPRGQSDFTLRGRTALTVHMMQSYSVFVLVSQFFQTCAWVVDVQEVSHRACRHF